MKKAPQELVVRTEKMVYGGQALARADRFVVFVDDALPNETVRVRLYKKKKQFAFGRAIEILEPAPERFPSMPLDRRLGGLHLPTAPIRSSLQKEVLVESLHGVPGPRTSSATSSPSRTRLRNKMVFSFGAT
jgi:23S rRNA (uracil1939-C5)-methyltransferase